MTFGGLTDQTKAGAYALGGGAVDLGAPAAAVFSAAAINQAWNPSPGVVVVDRTDFVTARISLSDDAQGTWAYLASAGGEIKKYQGPQYLVVDGHLVPEPATLSVMGAGALALIRRRQRQCSRRCRERPARRAAIRRARSLVTGDAAHAERPGDLPKDIEANLAQRHLRTWSTPGESV